MFPGLAPGDSFFINGRRRRRSSRRTPRAAIRTIYHDLLNRAWADAKAPRRKAAADLAEGHPADRAGAAMRRRLVPLGSSRARGARAPRASRSRTTSPRTTSRSWVMADWMMDMFFIFSGLAFVAFLAAWKAGHFHELENARAHPAARRGGGLLHARLGARRGGVGRWRCRAVTRRRRRTGVLRLPAGAPPDRAHGRHVARRLALARLDVGLRRRAVA